MNIKKITAVLAAAAMLTVAAPMTGVLPDPLSVRASAEEFISVSDVMKAAGVVSEVNAGEESPAEDFEYSVNEDGESVTITEYNGNGGNVVIPGEIEGKKVTVIGNWAFSGCASLTSVEIPDSVTSMGYGVFENCTSLTSVEISNSVTEIGSSAFRGCTSLTSVEIPSSVTEIGESAFENCTSLTSVKIPNSVTEIGESAFENCTSLTSAEIPSSVTIIRVKVFKGCTSLKAINVDEKNTNFSSKDGVLFYNNMETLVQYPVGKTDKNYSIPEGVKLIGQYAFYKCASLSSVKIPDGITIIGEGAFNSCASLASAQMPDSVTGIYNYAFEGCTSLTLVKIPDGVELISLYAFRNCTALKDLQIPDSVTEIGERSFEGCTSLLSVNISKNVEYVRDYAFNSCTSLTSINVDKDNTYYFSKDGVLFGNNSPYQGDVLLIQYPAGKTDKSYSVPDAVTHIYDRAFCDCTSLTSINIPKSVTKLDYNRYWGPTTGEEPFVPFSGCTSLKSINVDEQNESYSSIDGVLFRKDKTELIYYPIGKTDKSYSIPNSVKWIGIDAFKGCTSLVSVEISNSVTSIGYRAFEGCTSLVSVEISNSVTWIGYHAFNGCTSLTSINVDEKNETHSSTDGVLFNKDKTELEQYPAGKTDKSYSIPNSVTSIGYCAFENCTSLVSVEIPNSVTSIGYSAFDGCPKLTIYGYENSYAHTYAAKNQIPFKVIGKIDKNSGIIIENSDLEGTILEVDKSADSNEEKIIYNITLKDKDGKEIQPEGEVTVKIPLPEGWDAEKATVSRRESNGTLTDMKAAYENGYMVFTTDHFSEYVISAVKPVAIKLGDPNKDGKVSTVDAKWVLQAISGSRTLTDEQKAAADVNKDGKITTVDAKWILQVVSGSRDLE